MSVDPRPDPVQTKSDGAKERQQSFLDCDQIAKRTWKARNEMVMNNNLTKSLKCVLIGLWSFYGKNEFCWPQQATLAFRCGYGANSVGALQKQLRKLKTMGIITIEKHLKEGLWRSNKYRINFEELSKFVEDAPALPESVPTEHWTAKRGTQYVSAEVQGTSPETYLSTYRNNQRTTTTEAGWNSVAAALIDFGIERIALLIDRATAAGVTPPRALELLAVATAAGRTSTGWKITPGMLFDRIVNDRQTLALDAGWHPEAQTLLNRAKARTAEQTRAAETAEKTAAVDATIAADRARRLKLLETYGPILDAMPAADFAALCDRSDLDHQERRAATQNRRSRLSLEKLIKHLRNEPESKETASLEAAHHE